MLFGYDCISSTSIEWLYSERFFFWVTYTSVKVRMLAITSHLNTKILQLSVRMQSFFNGKSIYCRFQKCTFLNNLPLSCYFTYMYIKFFFWPLCCLFFLTIESCQSMCFTLPFFFYYIKYLSFGLYYSFAFFFLFKIYAKKSLKIPKG
jgi:hypothetical protein